MTSAHRIPSLLVLLLAVVAAPAMAVVPDPPGPNSRQVARPELEESMQSNLYDFVRSHRPMWLRTRGVGALGAAEVAVILDGQPIGGPEELRMLSVLSTTSLRYLDGREATTLWGTDHGSGAILVSTRPLPAEPRGPIIFFDMTPEQAERVSSHADRSIQS